MTIRTKGAVNKRHHVSRCRLGLKLSVTTVTEVVYFASQGRDLARSGFRLVGSDKQGHLSHHLRWCVDRSVRVGSSLVNVDVTSASVYTKLISAAVAPEDHCSCTTLYTSAIKHDKVIPSTSPVAVGFDEDM